MGAHSRSSEDTEQLSYRELLSPPPTRIDAESMQIDPAHFSEVDPAPVATAKTFTIDLLDRAVRTALQTAIGYLLIGGSLALPVDTASWLMLGSIVAAAVIMSVATAMLSAPSFSNNYWYQLVERAVKTFCQSIIAGFSVTVATGQFFALPHNFLVLLTSSGVAALTSLLTSIYTTNLGTAKSVGTVNLSV